LPVASKLKHLLTILPSADRTYTISSKAIAVFDSGLGGLTVAAAIHRLLPGEDLVFLADRARVPYASLSPALIARFAGECFDFLVSQEPKAVVIACNTVSAVALETLAGRSPVPVLGVIEPTARAAATATRTGKIGVIATAATVKRRAYDLALGKLIPKVQIISNGCPLLVPLVEEGWTEGDIPRRIVEHYLDPIVPADVDTLIMGCTHYEYFRSVIQGALGDHVSLINTPEVTAQELKRLLGTGDMLYGGARAGQVKIYSTDVTDALHRVVQDLFAESLSEGRVTVHHAQVPSPSVSHQRAAIATVI
jgi:glutamate racemase